MLHINDVDIFTTEFPRVLDQHVCVYQRLRTRQKNEFINDFDLMLLSSLAKKPLLSLIFHHFKILQKHEKNIGEEIFTSV